MFCISPNLHLSNTGYILVVSNSNNAVSLELGPVNGVATSTDICTNIVQRFKNLSTNDITFFSVDDSSTVQWLKVWYVVIHHKMIL